VVTELWSAADRPVREALQEVVSRVAAQGLHVERVTLPEIVEAREDYASILVAEAAAVHGEALRDRSEVFSDTVRSLLARGAAMPAPEYIRARRRRAELAQRCDEVLAVHECLLTPTTLVPAPPVGAGHVEVNGRLLPTREALIACTCPFSMIGLPAVSIPAAVVEDLPVGLQIVGRRGSDYAVLEVARRTEELLSGGRRALAGSADPDRGYAAVGAG
jgi:Asp-tRNA(Asn)/Glu-tRNA(Gln) amidotransferase A subunit family amidase